MYRVLRSLPRIWPRGHAWRLNLLAYRKIQAIHVINSDEHKLLYIPSYLSSAPRSGCWESLRVHEQHYDVVQTTSNILYLSYHAPSGLSAIGQNEYSPLHTSSTVLPFCRPVCCPIHHAILSKSKTEWSVRGSYPRFVQH